MDSAEVAERKRIIQHFRTEVDFDDMPEEAWALLDHGRTLGLFQIEAGVGAKRLAAQMRPRSVADVAVQIALNKPGPLRSGDTQRYLKRRSKDDEVSYPDPILEDILADTYGVFVFQEQVIAYFSAIGYSAVEADNIRKIVGKKKPDEMLAEYPRYLKRAQEHMTKAHAESIWNLIVNYSKYGFNKAHAVAYATILAWTLYCKWRWPVEFYMASIETNPKKVGAYVAEARQSKINVMPPDVNLSQATISKTDNGIIYGLSDIKGVKAAAANIVEHQPYADLTDFMQNSGVNAGIKKGVSRAGALDSFGARIEVCEQCEGKGRVPKMVPKKNGDGEKRILVDCEHCIAASGFMEAPIPNKMERAQVEMELLGVVLTDIYEDLVASCEEDIEGLPGVGITNQEEDYVDKQTVGIITNIILTKTKQGANPGQSMCLVDLIWDDDPIRAVVFPKNYQRLGWVLKEHTLCKFKFKPGRDSPQLVEAEYVARAS